MIVRETKEETWHLKAVDGESQLFVEKLRMFARFLSLLSHIWHILANIFLLYRSSTRVLCKLNDFSFL